jgi:very-short-patch-repair endonuclease
MSNVDLAFLAGEIQNLRSKLIDIGRRNLLIAFKHSAKAVTYVRIVDSTLDGLFAALDGESRVFVRPLPDDTTEPADQRTPDFQLALATARLNDSDYLKVVEDDGSTEQQIDEAERALIVRVREALGLPRLDFGKAADPVAIARAHGINPTLELPEGAGTAAARSIQTLLLPEKLDARLRSIEDRYKGHSRETGVHTLQLILGFLEWRETAESDETFFAPLLTYSVELSKNDRTSHRLFSLSGRGEPLVTNMALQEMLRSAHDIRLPDIDDDEKPTDWLRKVRESIGSNRLFRIRPWATLAVLPFPNMAIWRDLDLSPTGWPELPRHGQVGILLGGREAETNAVARRFPPDHPIDAMAPADVPPIVLEADVSQHSALVDVIGGKSLALEGPPGTGKSQTITNMIAGALAHSKTVLFVAEKRAALEVVASKLRLVGLGPLTLELHAEKSVKTKVMESIKQAYDLKLAPQSGPSSKLAMVRDQVLEKRRILGRYLALLRKPVSSLDESVGDLVWREMRLRRRLELAEVSRLAWGGPDAMAFSAERLGAARRLLDAIESIAMAIRVGGHETSPWRHADRLPTDEISQQDVLDDLTNIVELVDNILHWKDRVALLVGHLDHSLDHCLAILRPIEAAPDLGETPAPIVRAALRDIERVATVLHTLKRHHLRLAALRKHHPDPTVASANLIRAAGAAFLAAGVSVRTPVEIKAVLDQQETEFRHLTATLARISSALEALGLEPAGLTLRQVSVLSGAVQSLSELGEPEATMRNSRLLENGRQVDLNVAKAEAEGLRALKNAHGNVNWSRVSTARVSDLEADVVALGRTAFLARPFSKSFKRAQGSVLEIIEDPPADVHECARRLGNVLRWRREADQFHAECRQRDVFGSHWRGHESDFDAAIEFVERVKSIEFALRRHGLDVIRTLLDARAIDLKLWAVELEAAESLGRADDATIEQVSQRLRDQLILVREAWTQVAQTGILPDGVVSPDLADQIEALQHDHNLLTTAAQIDGDWFAGPDQDIAPMERAVGFARSLIAAKCHASISARLMTSADPVGDASSLGVLASEGHKLKSGLAEAWANFSKTYEIDSPKFLNDQTSVLSVILTDLRHIILTARADLASLKLFSELGRLQREARTLGADWVYWKVSTLGYAPARLADVFELALLRAILTVVLRGDGAEVLRLGGHQLANAREAFRELDAALARLEARRILIERLSDPVPRGNGMGSVKTYTEAALLENEMQKKSRIIALRDLVTRAGRALQAVKPVWMMSPTTLAQFAPPKAVRFDLVVIDEASQMTPEMAIGALGRGAQVVVVGDPKQLPPSSHFQVANDGVDGDGGAADAAESILDLANLKLGSKRRLKWHYRSHHEQLINFSNREFYDDDLVVFPSASEPSDYLGVRSIFTGGLYKGRINEDEAKVVINEAVGLMIARPDLSLGIVTMNADQRDYIFLLFEKLKGQDSTIRDYVAKWEGTIDEFFIKNLENVQGDERDIIIMSTLYGPAAAGERPAQRFGLFNRHDEGHRRLNVLVTRARRSNWVVTSLRPADVTAGPATSRGVQAFQRYLAYAAEAPMINPEQPGHEAESDFEVFVAERLRAHGYQVTYQVGVQTFRIDLGVKHDSYPVGYLAGIECDGARYHGHYTIRDRDKIRQSVLEQLGWKIWRVWSTDWFNNPDREFGRLIEWLDRLRDDASARFARMGRSTGAKSTKLHDGLNASMSDRPTNISPGDSGRNAEPMNAPLHEEPRSPSDDPESGAPAPAGEDTQLNLPGPAPRGGPTGTRHETPGDAIIFYEDLSLPGFYEVWSDLDVIGTVERVGGAIGAARVFGGSIKAPMPEYVGTRNWNDTTFRAPDIYAAVRKIWSDYAQRE